MILKELLASTPIYELVGLRRIDIKGIVLNPEDVEEGYLYIYLPEESGPPYKQAVDKAVDRGAAAICIGKEQEVLSHPVTFIKTYNCKRFLSAVSRNFYHNPSQNMNLVGVTGSHGKTTVGWMVKSILNVSGIKSMMMGSSYYEMGDGYHQLNEGETNPLFMNELLQKAVKNKFHWGIIECAYTGIVDEQFRHVWFNSIIYTDLYTYFHNKEADDYYFNIRKTLLDHLKVSSSPVVVNMDDFYAAQLQRSTTVGYGLFKKNDVNACDIRLSPLGSCFTLVTSQGSRSIKLQVPGIHNVYNALAAAAWGIAQGFDIEDVVEALEGFSGVLGATEQDSIKGDISIHVNSISRADRFDSLLDSLKGVIRDRMVTVLCIGECKGVKEYNELAKLIGQQSAQCIITSDYSCLRNTMDVAFSMAQKMEGTNIKYEMDHYKALRDAVSLLKNGGSVHILSVE